MGLLRKTWAYCKVMMKGRKNRWDMLSWLWRRPLILLGIGATEGAHFLSGRTPTKLKVLAQCKISSMIGCPF